jgi:pyruvate-formate lyase-activating enzyme/predicted phosphodiesterase
VILERFGRILVFGGCYSNLQATEALFKAAARLGIDPVNMFCTGDIVAYGADAAATLRLVRDSGVASIAGNCETRLAAEAEDCGCGFAPGSACDVLAADWYAHARAQMTREDRDYMAGLPEQLRIMLDGVAIRLLHGNAERQNAFLFGSASDLEFSRQLTLSGCEAVFAGHAGLPFTRRVPAGLWHNAGSIGLPANDGTPRGWFSLVEVRAGALCVERVALDYDFRGAAGAMRAAGLPEVYAATLETGIWPSHDVLPAAERLRTGVPVEAGLPWGRAPFVELARLETLWVNTGSRCNLSCAGCFMESSPSNDSLAYFSRKELAAFLADAPAGLREVGFTGGEPFMNPDITAMLEMVLTRGLRALVLTNGMRPTQLQMSALAWLAEAHPGALHVRVSLDHFARAPHEALRGSNSFGPALAGLKALAEAGVVLSVAARTPWGESEAAMRAGFARLFAAQDVAIDAQDPARLVLFPEMDGAARVPPVTEAALAVMAEGTRLMCATSRMLVRRKDAAAMEVTPCTLLPGRTLSRLEAPVLLDHDYCAQFCVFGGGNCAGAA